jgi:hypothetical protein
MKKNILFVSLLHFLATACTAASVNSNLNYTQKIQKIVSASTCSQSNWKNRGRAPAGYLNGVALSFSRSLCRLKMTSPFSDAARIMSEADRQNDQKDALTHYQSILFSLRLKTSSSGEETLRTDFTLGMGLGMRESSGKYCTGWDINAGANRPSSEAEAGAFQVSSNSMAATPELKILYNEYKSSPERCLLNVFKEGATCQPQSILGTGFGADFQNFNKNCPAFATEYAMTLLRVLRSHFGPINRREAEVKTECNDMLKQVQNLIDKETTPACEEIF